VTSLRGALLGLLLLFILLRALHLFTAIELVSFDEELYRGTIALELLTGPKTGLWAYQADDYSGGSLVVGALAAPLFALLGPRLLVLKLVPLGFTLATLLLVIVFLRWRFGARAAVLGAALFVLAPPAFTQLSWLAMGFHSESLLFSMLILLAFERLRTAASHHAAWAALLGVLAGLGFWFTYITALTTLACVGAGLILKMRSGWAPAAAGFGLGLTPWLAFNLAHGFRGLQVPTLAWPDEALASAAAGLAFIARRAILVPAVGVPYSFAFPSVAGLPGAVLAYIYTLAALVTLIWSLAREGWRPASSLLAPVLLAGIFYVAYVITGGTIPHGGHVIEARYFPPLHLVLLLVLAVALPLVPPRRALTLLLLGLGAVGQSSLLFQHWTPGVTRYAGYSYGQLGHLWQSRQALGPDTAAHLWPVLDRFPPARARMVFSGFVDGGFAEWRRDLTRLRQVVAQSPAPYRPLLAEGLGYAAGLEHAGEVDGLQRAITYAPTEFRDHFYRGLSGGMASRLAARPAEHLERLGLIEPFYRHHFYASLGLVLRRCYAPRASEHCPTTVPDVSALDGAAQAALYRGLGQGSVAIRVRGEEPTMLLFAADVVPARYRADFFWGLGWTLRETFSEDRARAVDWIRHLPAAERPRALDGLRAAEAWYRLEDE
jgi:hypothetical protein